MPPKFNIGKVLAGPSGKDFFQGFHDKSYPKGSLVCSGDLDENGVFVVMAGRLRVFLVGEGREITLFYLGPWDIFSLHSGCLVEACEASELRVTDIVTFERKMLACPDVAFSMVSVFGRAIESCIRTVQDLVFHDIRQRIVGFFVESAETRGHPTAAGVEVRTAMTVEEIALLIQSGRQATSTAIGCLIKEGLIVRLSRGHYVIPDVERLRAAGQSAEG